jgi:hypothetical protein
MPLLQSLLALNHCPAINMALLRSFVLSFGYPLPPPETQVFEFHRKQRRTPDGSDGFFKHIW